MVGRVSRENGYRRYSSSDRLSGKRGNIFRLSRVQCCRAVTEWLREGFRCCILRGL